MHFYLFQRKKNKKIGKNSQFDDVAKSTPKFEFEPLITTKKLSFFALTLIAQYQSTAIYTKVQCYHCAENDQKWMIKRNKTQK